MIPKRIHYCWYGNNEMPDLYGRCLESWKKHLKDYEIIRWDESNTNFDSDFLIKAKKQKHWAFISDYIRMRAIHTHGGIYLDADFEVIKSLDPLLLNQCFLGYESRNRPTTGIIGSIPGHSLPQKIMELINKRHKSGLPYLIAPEVAKLAISNTESRDIKIYAEDFFYPYNPYDKNRNTHQLMHSDLTENTYAIHHWGKSWKQGYISRALKKILKANPPSI